MILCDSNVGLCFAFGCFFFLFFFEGSWMPEEAHSRMKADVQNICSRPLAKLTIGADLPRLIKNMKGRIINEVLVCICSKTANTGVL